MPVEAVSAETGPSTAGLRYEDAVPGALAATGAADEAERSETPPADASGSSSEAAGSDQVAGARASAPASRGSRREAKAAVKAERARVRAERRAAKDAQRREREERKRTEDREREEREQAERAQAEQERQEAERAREAADRELREQEAEERRRAETEQVEAEERTRRREREKAAAVAALAAAPGVSVARAQVAPAVETSPDDEVESPDGASDEDVPDEAEDAQEPPADAVPDSGEPTQPIAAVDEQATEDEASTSEDMVTSESLDDTQALSLVSLSAAEGEVGDEAGQDRRRRAAERLAQRREAFGAKAAKTQRRRNRNDRGTPAGREDADVPEPPSVQPERSDTWQRVVVQAANALAVVSFVFSVLLAVAALLLGAGVTDAGAAGTLYSLADAASTPVSGIVTLSGEDADVRNAFVAYGLGSLLYLAIAFAIPKVARVVTGR